MKFKFTCRITAWDYWQLSMYNTYSSIVGVCNIIFTAAVILLTFRFWGSSDSFMRSVLLFGCCLFPLIQPLVVYLQAAGQVKGLPEQMEMGFDDAGIHVEAGGKRSDLKWDMVRSVQKRPTLLVIFSSASRGYVLSNRVLGKDRKALYEYVVSKAGKTGSA